MTEREEIRMALFDIQRRLERLERIVGQIINALNVEQQLRIDYRSLEKEQKP